MFVTVCSRGKRVLWLLFWPGVFTSEHPNQRLSDLLDLIFMGMWDLEMLGKIQEKEMATTPLFLPGESQGWGSPVGCHLWGHTELDTTEVT